MRKIGPAPRSQLLVVGRRWSLVVRRWSFVVGRRSSLVVGRSSLVVGQSRFVEPTLTAKATVRIGHPVPTFTPGEWNIQPAAFIPSGHP